MTKEMTELLTQPLVNMEQRGDDGNDGADDKVAGKDGAARRRWR